jgi:hypothetical protein
MNGNPWMRRKTWCGLVLVTLTTAACSHGASPSRGELADNAAASDPLQQHDTSYDAQQARLDWLSNSPADGMASTSLTSPAAGPANSEDAD